jgi:hypothetical protein
MKRTVYMVSADSILQTTLSVKRKKEKTSSFSTLFLARTGAKDDAKSSDETAFHDAISRLLYCITITNDTSWNGESQRYKEPV